MNYHKPIIVQHIELRISQKICFEDFSTQIQPGKRIVIIGANGTGKSTLLKIIQGVIEPSRGKVTIPDRTTFGYVPQTIIDYPELSGGQRFNKALSQALSLDPDVLCLDEPTNHLDMNNKRSLIRLLRSYQGTLIIVSHDPDVLTLDFDEIWHVERGAITVFAGNYSEYLKDHERKQLALQNQREKLHKEKREMRKHAQLEHKRAAQSRAANKNETDRNLLGIMKESGSRSTGKNLKRLSKAYQEVQKELADTCVLKSIEPKFNLDARKLSSQKAIVSVANGSCFS